MNKTNKKLILSLLSISMSLNMIFASFASLEIDPFNHVYRHENRVDKSLLDDNIINFEEISDLIFNYNPIVRNLWNNFEVNKETDDIADDYYDLADSLEGMDTGSDIGNAQASAQAKGLRVSGDNSVVDSNINYLNNIKVEKSLILATELAMINYHKAILDEKKAKKSMEELTRSINSAKLNYEYGNLTKSELLKKESEYKKAEANLISKESEVINYKRNVYINCGYNMSSDAIITEVPHADINVLKNIDYKNDLNKAFETNLQYEIYKRSLENSRSEEMKNTNTINVNNAKRFIENDLETKSRNIIDAIASYDAAICELDDNKNAYSAAENKYKDGNISKNEYETAKYNYEVSEYNINLAKYDIDIAYINYLEAVNGLASAGN